MADQKIVDVIRDYLENIPENLSFVGETQVYFDSLSGKRNDYSPLGTDSARLSKNFARLNETKLHKQYLTDFILPVTQAGQLTTDIKQKIFKTFQFLRRNPSVADKALVKNLQDDFLKWRASLPPQQINTDYSWNGNQNLLSKDSEDFVSNLLEADWKKYILALEDNNKKYLFDFLKSALDETIQMNEFFDSYGRQRNIPIFAEKNTAWLLKDSDLTPDAKKSLVFWSQSSSGTFSTPFPENEMVKGLNPDEISELVDRTFRLEVGSTQKMTEYMLANSFMSEISSKGIKYFNLTNITETALRRETKSEEDFWIFLLDKANIDHTENKFTKDDFEFLGRDFENLQTIVSAPEASKILLISPPGLGATSLVKAVAQAAGKTVVGPSDQEKETVNLSRVSVSRRPNSLLVFDKMPMDSTWTKVLSAPPQKTTEIWIVSNEKEISTAAMGTFDFVVKMPAMPYQDRLQLAQKSFKADVAERIAKTCATPLAITKMSTWSKRTGQTEWSELSSVVSAMQHAAMSSTLDASKAPVSLILATPDDKGFAGVVGCDDLVEQARKIIAGLKNPERFEKLGAKPPKGVLLTGDPGTGKTHLVRAMAQEAGVPLVLASSAAMAQSPEKISAVFNEAKKQAPCILFLDELDAVGSKGTTRSGDPASPERQAILNRLLTEIDGFEGLKDVLVVGATHREHHLDEALTRSGRLGWRLHFDMPEKSSRVALFQFYLPLADANWERTARASSGMSPADIHEVCKRATLFAAYDDADSVKQKHITKAIDDVLWGEMKDKKVQDAEVYRTAVHEAGHALLAWHQKLDIDRVCVRPTQHALGFVRHFKDEEKMGFTKEEAEDNMRLLFAGLVAEEAVLGARSFGASNDLQKARRWAERMVLSEGMLDGLPGGLSLDFGSPPTGNAALEEAQEKIQTILKDQKTATSDFVSKNKAFVKALAEHLVTEREITGDELHAFAKANRNLLFVNDQTLDLPLVSRRNVSDKLREKKPHQGDIFDAPQKITV